MRSLPAATQLLLVTQMLFNVGFYLVVPFLANYMTESLAATGAIVGIVLGLRTFSQQGLFFIGGGLTDRFGVKPVLLTGVAIRVIGFIAAGLSHNIEILTLSVVLIGFAAALFSPAAEAAFAETGRCIEEHGGMTRSELFALDAFFSRIGALTGPLLGAVVINQGFNIACFIAAGIFAFLFFSHLLVIPSVRTQRQQTLGFGTVLRNRTFLWFALAYSTGLVAYNQQYLALPAELRRATGSADALGWMFVYSSILVLTLQIPIARLGRRLGHCTAITTGFALQALGFATLAAWHTGSYLPALTMLTLLHTGQMLAIPLARDIVGKLAGEQQLGAYYGFLNSFGGGAVLIGSAIVGYLLDYPAAYLPWLFLAATLGCSVIALAKITANNQP